MQKSSQIVARQFLNFGKNTSIFQNVQQQNQQSIQINNFTNKQYQHFCQTQQAQQKYHNNISENIQQNSENQNHALTLEKKHKFDDPECSNCLGKNFKRNKFICGSCKTLLPPERKLYKIDFFELFGLQQTYEIDKKFLEAQYKELMQNFHPDRYFSLNDKIVLKDCEEYSMYVNSAHQSLKSDYQRAYYYLEIKGKLQDNQESIIEDMDFLDDLLFLREEIQSCRDIEQLQKIKENIQIQYNQIVQKLTQNFHIEDYEQANSNLNLLKYHESTLELILKKEENL